MAANTAYLISYNLDSLMIDLNAVLPKEDYLKVERVEYPVSTDTPTHVVFEVFGDILLIKGKDVSLTEDNHLRIIYLQPWAMPGAQVEGNYPRHLDNALVIGSCGQSLIFKAEKYVQQAVTEIALANVAADSMATPLGDINTALDKVTTHVTEAGTALAKVATYLETNGTTDNAKEILADITDNITDLRNAIETALDLSSTYLTGATNPSAKQYLDDGDAYILTVNDADRVAEKYAEYSQAAIQIFSALAGEASIRLQNILSYIQEAEAWMKIGDTFIAEAGQRLGMATAFVNEAVQRVNEVNAWGIQADKYTATSEHYLDIAGRYLASGQAKINEFLVSLGIKAEGSAYKGLSEQFS